MIRRHRLRLKLSMRALAAKTGLHAGSISRYESGETVPTLRVALRLAKVLKVPVEKLFREAR
jgi:transcriptional regulator with XRE-family HTH domain